METSTIIALAALVVTLVGGALGFATFWMNFSTRIGDANSKADAAAKQAESVGKQASAATARVITVEKELTDLRVEVARDYVSTKMLDGFEKRVTEAINGLGVRIDHAFAKGN
ncbi:hypothetical protein AOQ73_05945 [Bradyrhizobium pachyrhizi]|uniref:hypothetical protein n=1 Tax=Bradyrhizobium pachyrhizi TaxID=280333 RepID=UPI000704DCD0|nr:hypothetical protein [Bradyrhizobium pachyrhizi]KRQ11948.1 hypothetical protein AOQ73_05945 [Bradyrhizobium pachyrhizi]